eukprot:TRINITY_DN4245_c0_g1_i2.p1 TRINITY_DN4245_c0_g1~~TRINITY_DN4245_c0_g1_i2.p1  ORF type:complete len:222 (-),score=15.80 TRINITY_DN4245_c0_g1_i2:80-745(-)
MNRLIKESQFSLALPSSNTPSPNMRKRVHLRLHQRLDQVIRESRPHPRYSSPKRSTLFPERSLIALTPGVGEYNVRYVERRSPNAIFCRARDSSAKYGKGQYETDLSKASMRVYLRLQNCTPRPPQFGKFTGREHSSVCCEDTTSRLDEDAFLKSRNQFNPSNLLGNYQKEFRSFNEGIRHMRILEQTAKAVLSSIHQQCCLLYTSPSPRDLSTSRMPSSA